MRKTRQIESLFSVFRVVAAILIAYAISLITLTVISDDPLNVIKLFITGPFSSFRRFGDMVALATPFMFAGLGMCFMYSVNKFNLVGNGAIVFAGCMSSLVALTLKDAGLPSPVFIGILFIVGCICGVIAASVPALLDAKFQANVVVVSLMLNYIFQFFAQYVLLFKMKDSSIAYSASHKLPESARLANIFPGANIHWGFVIAIVCVILCSILFYKTTLGYSMRTVGSNPAFARFAGLNVTGTVIASQLLGGALAGLGGVVEVFARYDRFQWDLSQAPQYGFDGLVVAVLAHKNPALIPVGAFILAYIRIGADIVTRSADIPAEFISIIQGIIILLIAAEMFLSNFKEKMIFKNAKRSLEIKEQSLQA